MANPAIISAMGQPKLLLKYFAVSHPISANVKIVAKNTISLFFATTLAKNAATNKNGKINSQKLLSILREKAEPKNNENPKK